MTTHVEHRRLWLLIPQTGGGWAVTGDLSPPTLDLSFSQHGTTVGEAVPALEALGVTAPILEVVIGRAPIDGDVYPAVVLTEPVLECPPSWTTAQHPDLTGLPADLTSTVDRWMQAEPHPGPPWTVAGWYQRASSWINRSLRDSGRDGSVDIAPVKQWGISAVMRASGAGATYWFKASFAHFRSEAATTALLQARCPHRLPGVIAVDPDARWLLTEDAGGVSMAERLDAAPEAIEALLDIQMASAPSADELVAAGCPRRPISEVADALAEALADPVVARRIDVTPEAGAAVISAVRRAGAHCGALGFTDTVVHGDFHPGNVLLAAHGPVIIDWSDTAITQPFVDVATWAWWCDDAAMIDGLWDAFETAWRRRLGVTVAAGDRSHLQLVAAAYHVVSYAGIVVALAEHQRHEHEHGLTHFWTSLLALTG